MNNLNTNQLLAVKTIDGPVLVIAGAGTGKTSVLTNRIAYLTNTLKVDSNRILAFTFTNKAGAEMKARLNNLVPNCKFSWIKTYHSTCLSILKIDIDKISQCGRNKNFTIIDDDDKKEILKNISSSACLELKINDIKNFVNKISTIKELSLEQKIRDYFNNQDLIEQLDMVSIIDLEKLSKAFSLYETELRKFNFMDFSDLINWTNVLLEQNHDVRLKWQKKFRYILVDEFQDTNYKQFCILKNLVDPEYNNVFAVGDPNQTIYTWRGAYANIFNDFISTFKDTKIIKLYENYRSTRKILSCANKLMLSDSFRDETLDNELVARNTNDFDVHVFIGNSRDEEVNFITRKITKLHDEGKSYNDMAILYRINSQSKNLEDKFIMSSIPYTIFGNVSFYQRKEIKDLISYIRIIYAPDDISLLRIINVPGRGVGKDTMENLKVFAYENKITLVDLTKNIEKYDVCKDFIKKRIISFWQFVQSCKTEIEKIGHSEIVSKIISLLNYESYLKEFDSSDYEDRIENAKELDRSVKLFFLENENSTIFDFLNQISLLSSADKTKNNGNSVKLMTVHNAKGLEFNTVFIVNFSEGFMPHKRLGVVDDLQEERRIAYVAFTRAINNLYITASNDPYATYYSSCEPSRFLNDIGRKNYIKDELEINTISTQDAEDAWFNSKRITFNDPKQHYNDSALADFNVGDTVVHTAFGSGIITNMSSDGNELTIIFKKPFGKKTIFSNHKALKRIIK